MIGADGTYTLTSDGKRRTEKWNQPRPRFRVTDDTRYIFAALTGRDDECAGSFQQLYKCEPELKHLQHFVYLAGITNPEACRCASRLDYQPDSRFSYLGFRVAADQSDR
jgi:hypothetical protein